MKTKKEIRELLKSGKLTNLLTHTITNGTTVDQVDALYLLFKQEFDSYVVEFESLPYSKGGRYKRHTSILTSHQIWRVVEYGVSGYVIETERTSKSANCPSVIIPKFYTEKGKNYHNAKIYEKIKELENKLLK